MPIYTGRGDEGTTDLRTMDRVSKDSPRIETFGSVDEVNALVGVARPTGYDDVDDQLRAIQNQLHVVQAELANPDSGADDPQVTGAHVEALEAVIDDATEELDPLSSFILPGGTASGARLHHARAVCRRAERRVVSLAAEETIDEHVVTYLNRLSDVLFTLARLVNERDGVSEDAPDY